MALAGDQKIIVPVQPQLDRAFELVGRHRRPHRHVAGLGLLAAKTATHAPAFHPHRVIGQAQGMSHPVLHLARVLGAAVDHPLALLLGQGVGHLAFQVKVFLAAHFQCAAELMRGNGQGGIGITSAHKHRWQHIVALLQRLAHAQHGGQGVNLQLHQARGTAGLHHVVSHHQAHHLAHMLYLALRKHRLVPGKGGQHGVARNIGRQHQAAHTGQCQCSRSRDPAQGAMGQRRQDGGGVQRAARLGHVVNVGGRPRHLSRCAFVVRRRTTCSGAHASNSSSPALSRLMARAPWLSSQKRCSRLPST